MLKKPVVKTGFLRTKVQPSSDVFLPQFFYTGNMITSFSSHPSFLTKLFLDVSSLSKKILYGMVILVMLFQVTNVRADSSFHSMPALNVHLRAATNRTIKFKAHNGADEYTEKIDLPHLVLYRNGILTEPGERTLIVEINNIKIPPSGVTVLLEITTQHTVFTSDEGNEKPFLVWRDERNIPNNSGRIQNKESIVFRHVFDDLIHINDEITETPTDYFKIDIRITDYEHPITNPLNEFSQDYAFLMERQWLVPLPEVLEESPGAAPDEMIVYYCDMFPFQVNKEDFHSRIPREKIPAYLESELIPAMVEAFQSETDQWGFPWYGEWTSFRPDEPPKRLSVALTQDDTWFHGTAPSRGLARISINVESENNSNYPTLTDSLMSNFYHELFHNLQRNILQHLGGNGDVDGIADAWQFFSEGTAVLASSVGQPEVQFTRSTGLRSYFTNANSFLAGGGIVERDLNRSYLDISPYHAAIYWRFLYEQCGGMSGSREDPGAGMQIIRNTLSALYTKTIVDISTSTDLVEHLPSIMDEALKRTPSCPFDNYLDSLNKFAWAVYALNLDNGRCSEPGFPAGCELHDPAEIYLDLIIPTIRYCQEEVIYDKSAQPFPAGIKSSFGMDFIDISLGPSAQGKSLTLDFNTAPEKKGVYNVQVWKLMVPGQGQKPRRIHQQPAASFVISSDHRDKHYLLSIIEIDLEQWDRLGLIITRIDPNEKLDPTGEYTFKVRSGLVE
jgi:hypothetical protein